MRLYIELTEQVTNIHDGDRRLPDERPEVSGTDEKVANSNRTIGAEAREGDIDPRIEHLIEQLRERSVELEDANRELRRTSHYRSLFIARMSHELRTPLTSILGFTEILLDQEPLTEPQRRFCQKIRDSGFQLQTSLNQLVDLSRLEVGQTEIFLQEFSLREALREACAGVSRFAQTKQVKLEYDLAPEITTVVSDRGKLRQILYSFLNWSISRSDADQRVNLYAELLDSSRLRFAVEDQGQPVTDPASVFDPEDSSCSSEADINKLGVIIGRRLLDVVDGHVELQNRDSGGLRTVIDVPARPTKG
jgi:signal transduction histidine kinase